VTAEASLVRAAELVREFRDLTTGTPPAGDQAVACHNDLAPGNTVYVDRGAGLRPVAFIFPGRNPPRPRHRHYRRRGPAITRQELLMSRSFPRYSVRITGAISHAVKLAVTGTGCRERP